MARLTKKRKIAILKGMRSRLAARGGWIKGDFRKTRAKGTVGFCLAGAARDAYLEIIGHEGPYVSYEDVVQALSIETLAKAKISASRQKLVEEDGHVATYYFNDARTTKKADVLALVDEKLAELEG